MTELSSPDGELAAGRCGANHHDPLGTARFPVFETIFLARLGIDQTFDWLAEKRFCQAPLIAGDAMADIFRAAFLRLPAPIGIGDEGAARPDQVGPAEGQDGFRRKGIVDRLEAITGTETACFTAPDR
jgi:hypothetical protein